MDIQDTAVDIESILSVNSRKSRYFNGHDKTIWVMIQGVVQTLFVRLPLAYIMSIQPNASLTDDRIGGTSFNGGWNRAECELLPVV